MSATTATTDPAPAPFLFVVGCGRSGTTLVRAMLDAHPGLAVPGESYFPLWLARRRSRYERAGRFDVDSYVADLAADPWFARWGIPADAVRARLEAAPPSGFADAVRATYACYASATGKPRAADKTPTFVLHVPALARLFPESRFLHVVRDGRDVALSLLAADWGPSRVGDAALHWRQHVRAGHRAGQALGDDRYLEVRYEDLVADPVAAAAAVCRFAELEFDDAMLRYADRAPTLLARLPDPEEHQNLRLPPTKGIRDWRGEMAPDDVALFEALAGDTLEAFGYQRQATSVGPTVRRMARRHRAAWTLRGAARRARRAAARAVGR
jgi:hypothetical protein